VSQAPASKRDSLNVLGLPWEDIASTRYVRMGLAQRFVQDTVQSNAHTQTHLLWLDAVLKLGNRQQV